MLRWGVPKRHVGLVRRAAHGGHLDGKLTAADMSTFRIPNVGVFGIDTGTPIRERGEVRDPGVRCAEIETAIRRLSLPA